MHWRSKQASKKPAFLSGLMARRGSLNTQHHDARALSRVAGHEAATQLAGHISGAAHMPKQHVIFDEGSVEAVEHLRKQDEEFCRRLRVAVEMGNEFCPTTVITAPCTSRPILNYMRTD
jgi:3-mercaptopyruvate sulfurtransferase SseA